MVRRVNKERLERPMAEKTFLLGVGAPKAGTTWLYKQLEKHPKSKMGFLKECHVFDALYVPGCEEFRTQTEGVLIRNQINPTRLINPLNLRRHLKMKRRSQFYKNPNLYFDYFASLLNGQSKHLTADITPSYAALPETALENIRRGFESRGVTVRVIYLMRDPVERCWSAVRMHRQRPQRDQKGNLQLQDEEVEHLRRVYRSERFVLRSQYNETLKRLRAVFETKQLKVCLYEDLFTPQKSDEIFEFLGLAPRPVNNARRINSTIKNVSIPLSLRKNIAEFYEDAYHGAATEFSEEYLLKRWESASYVFRQQ